MTRILLSIALFCGGVGLFYAIAVASAAEPLARSDGLAYVEGDL